MTHTYIRTLLEICISIKGVQVCSNEVEELAVLGEAGHTAGLGESESLHRLEHVHHSLSGTLVNDGHQGTEQTTSTHGIPAHSIASREMHHSSYHL